MSEAQQTRRFIVRGRVQGVCFRASTRDMALPLGINGYAKNLGDGSVEVLAQGSADALAALESYLHRGPRFAHVDAVDVAIVEPAAIENGFCIC